jgi:hypothetical protein
MGFAMSLRVPSPHALSWCVQAHSAALLFLLTTLLQARWGLSSDVSFQEVGSSTGIRYFQDYEEYFTILEIGLRRRKKTIINIFKEWDANIFPDTDSSLAGVKSNDTSYFKVLMASVEEDDTDEEPEGDNTTAS